MSAEYLKSNYKNPAFIFCVGWCLVLLSGWIPFLIGLDTFTHGWRVETAASVFLLVVPVYLLYRNSDVFSLSALSRHEINFIVLPILLFIVWSALSILWSSSWKSAFYHTLMWGEYLIFYLLVRSVLEVRGSFRISITLVTTVFLIIALPAIIEYFGFLYFGGASTLGVRFAKYGEQINTFFPLLIVGVLVSRGKLFIAGLLAVTMLWLFMFSGFGRTNILLFAGGTIVLTLTVFIFKRFHKHRRKMTLVAAVLIVAPFLYHAPTLLVEKDFSIVARAGDADTEYSGNFRKLTAAISVEMIKTHPLIGIGADNFGLQFNKYREIYAEKNPSDSNLVVAEVELAERSHNELLQIALELGIVGLIIALWFISGIVSMAFSALKNWRRVSLFSLAALLGLGLFAASSMVSSFSFRFIQHGFVFFFVLAVAAKLLIREKRTEKTAAQKPFFIKFSPFVYAAGIIVCLSMLGFCAVRVASALYVAEANRTESLDAAISLYQTAVKLDDENANAPYFCGQRLLTAGRYGEAIPQFTETIAKQAATSPNYSYLAAAQTLSGDAHGASQTFAAAVKLYPFSPFVRTRYALLLKADNQPAEAERQMNFALALNRPQAVTWSNFISGGVFTATKKSFDDPNISKVEKLMPFQAVIPVTIEREIVHPEEKVSTDVFKFSN